MNKPILFLCIIIILGFIGSYIFLSSQIGHIVTGVFILPGPATKIDLNRWEQLRVGMTKDQVIELIGDASSKHKVAVGHDKNNVSKKIEQNEFWEYNSHSSLFGGPHPRAYVIYFDSEGKVSFFRKSK